MFSGIVYGSSSNSPACDIAWKTCTKERWDSDRPYDIIVKGCHTWLVRGAYVCCVGQVYTLVGLVIDSDIRDTLGYE
jgi:hypothetical protein